MALSSRRHHALHHSQLGDEKHEMLDLNRRLEIYLSRVKHLEEENVTLAEEIGALRHSKHGAPAHRKHLEEELRLARLQVDAAWGERVHAELEVGRLTEEIRELDLLRQREAQAHVKAKVLLDESRKELEEEQRAQIWLREKVSQLEQEMRFLIQTHQDDVTKMEAELTHSRATVVPMSARGGEQTPNLVQLGQEFSQRASRAWQEAAEAHQDQLAQLEESLHQARSRLSQADQEKRESQLRLRALEKEITSAQEVRQHLETTVGQLEDKHQEEIQHLQTHLEGLEVEREELGEQIDHLLLENRGLLQLKTSLGLEVATYRALLDSEGLRGDVSLSHPTRRVSMTDALFAPLSLRKSHRTQSSTSIRTNSTPSVSVQRRTAATVTTPLFNRKPVSFSKTPKISRKPADTAKSQETSHPKILRDVAAESFRPQEGSEKFIYAEPLSPPVEQEVICAQVTSETREGEEDSISPEETAAVEMVVSHQVELGLSTEPLLGDDFTGLHLTPYTLHHVGMTEKSYSFSVESHTDEIFKAPDENKDMQQLKPPAEAEGTIECTNREEEHEHEETSDSETQAVLEPTPESATNSPASECDLGENVFHQATDFNQAGTSSDDDAVEIREEISSASGTKGTDAEDKLYPDGEEMDTWDSVIEKKVEQKSDDGMKKDEVKTQHAEPEEDISARDNEKKETSQDVTTDVHKDGNVAGPVTNQQTDDVGPCSELDQEEVEGEEDEEEDSQNISVSWRTELESESYAQDNTLADTRPLIRYKSDETDGNTQASHMDESESSEGDQEKPMMGEMGSGTWIEGKTRRFGTMEDLCEEVEGEAADEEHDLGYAHTEDRDRRTTVSEQVAGVPDAEPAEEMMEISESHADEDDEEGFTTVVNQEEELKTDCVEQELETLCTDTQQVSTSDEMLHLQAEPGEDMRTEQDEAGRTHTGDMASCTESETSQLTSSTTTGKRGSSAATHTPPEREVQHTPEDTAGPEIKEEDDEHSVSMVKHGDLTEDCPGSPDFLMQENLHDVAASTEGHMLKESAPADASDPQGHLVEDVVNVPNAPDTTEWEVLENLSKESEMRDQTVHLKCEGQPHDDRGSDEGVILMREEEPFETSPDSVPDENQIFLLKESTEQFDTSVKDSSLPGVFSSGMKADFWVSSLEAAATYQPEDVCIEQTNQNLEFEEKAMWGDSDISNVVYGNTLAAETKQEVKHPEVTPALGRNVVDHSEESEVEGESWSSGEEPV